MKPTLSPTHSPAAMRLAEILIPEGINRRGRASRLKTSYGDKTREGVADMIDRETGLPEIVNGLKELGAYLASLPDAAPGSVAEVNQCSARYLVKSLLSKAARS